MTQTYWDARLFVQLLTDWRQTQDEAALRTLVSQFIRPLVDSVVSTWPAWCADSTEQVLDVVDRLVVDVLPKVDLSSNPHSYLTYCTRTLLRKHRNVEARHYRLRAVVIEAAEHKAREQGGQTKHR